MWWHWPKKIFQAGSGAMIKLEPGLFPFGKAADRLLPSGAEGKKVLMTVTGKNSPFSPYSGI
jgi:hypothetical protein